MGDKKDGKGEQPEIRKEDVAREIRAALRRSDPQDLNPELVRLKMVKETMSEKNKALTEITARERKAIAQIRMLDQAFKFKDSKTGEVKGGLPMMTTFCNEYMDLGACLERKREDAVVAMLRPKSSYNYKMGYDDEEQPKSLFQKLMEFITGRKAEQSKR